MSSSHQACKTVMGATRVMASEWLRSPAGHPTLHFRQLPRDRRGPREGASPAFFVSPVPDTAGSDSLGTPTSSSSSLRWASAVAWLSTLLPPEMGNAPAQMPQVGRTTRHLPFHIPFGKARGSVSHSALPSFQNKRTMPFTWQPRVGLCRSQVGYKSPCFSLQLLFTDLAEELTRLDYTAFWSAGRERRQP